MRKTKHRTHLVQMFLNDAELETFKQIQLYLSEQLGSTVSKAQALRCLINTWKKPQ